MKHSSLGMVISCWMIAFFLVAGCNQESASSGREKQNIDTQTARTNTSQGKGDRTDSSLRDPEPLYEESAILSPEERQSLQLHWPPNKRFIYETSVIQRTSANNSPLADMIRSDAQQQFTYALETNSRGPDGTQIIKVTYLSAKLMIDMVGNEIAYDSKQKVDTTQNDHIDEENPLRGLDALMGASISIALDASGKIQQIDGMEVVNETLNQTIPGQLRSVYEAMIREDEIKGLVQYGFLPENTVSAGDTWKSRMTQSILLEEEVVMNNRYKYLGTLPREEGLTHIIEFSENLTKGPIKEDPTLGIIISGGQGKGAIILDAANRTLIEYQSMQNLSLGAGLPTELAAQMPKAGNFTFHVIKTIRLIETKFLAVKD